MNKKNGFTLVETITAFIVMLIVVSSVSLAITLTLKINREQKMTNIANTLAIDIVNKLVRTQTFEYLYTYIDSNGRSIKNNGVTLAGLEVNSLTGALLSTSTTNIIEKDKGFVRVPISSEIASGSIQSQSFPDLKLLENGVAMLKIYPIITGYNNNGTILPISDNNIGTPVVSDNKISVSAVVRWGKIDQVTGLPSFKIELPTIVSENGMYSLPVVPNSTQSTSSPSPTPTTSPVEVGLPNGFTCTSNSQCQSGNCSGGICQNPQ